MRERRVGAPDADPVERPCNRPNGAQTLHTRKDTIWDRRSRTETPGFGLSLVTRALTAPPRWRTSFRGRGGDVFVCVESCIVRAAFVFISAPHRTRTRAGAAYTRRPARRQ